MEQDNQLNKFNNQEDRQSLSTKKMASQHHHRSSRRMDERLQIKRSQVAPQCGKSQLSSFILFASLIIMINLCPFETDPEDSPNSLPSNVAISNKSPVILQTEHLNLPITTQQLQQAQGYAGSYLSYLRTSMEFVRLMFSQPIRLNKRAVRYTQAEARVLGKMAKVWYIKKKIKKLGKKLKKHTIAVPVFTAIPIYEHSYYPQPHVTHVSHGGMHHAAAASSYAPATIAQMSAAASNTIPMTSVSSSSQQQMATSASNQHQVATYRMAPHRQHGGGGMYHGAASAHHIINAYAPSPPLFVDDTGGLYGHYGNAYGRYDGGYHVW